MVLKSLFFISFVVALFTSCDNVDLSAPIGGASSEKQAIPSSVEPTQLFLQHCSSCHGMEGDKGVSNAANLKKSLLIDLQIKTTIQKGNTSGMPAFGEVLTEPEILALVEYVKMLRTR